MCVRSFVLAAALLAVTGCAGNVTAPLPGLDHPANPKAAAAPLPPSPTIPEASEPMGGGMQGMQGMSNGSVQGIDHGSMKGMNHGSMQGMQGMEGMQAMEGMDHGSMQGMKGMDHGAHEHGDEHGPSAAGQPGDESQVDRTVEVTAHDTMSYKPQSLAVKPGETIRFAVTNAGKIRHEFVIGAPEEQREHEQMMQEMPNMVHEDPGAVTLEPGETKTLIWQFSKPGVFEFACHVPGHYPAGMVGKVQVGTAGAAGEDEPQMNMEDMEGMDHGSMKGMDQDSMQGMEGMKGMGGMENMKDMQGMEGEQHAH